MRPYQTSPALPITISEWRRNAREQVRVALGQYNDCHTVDIRTWFVPTDGGELTPTRTGITLSLKHLPALAAALVEALAKARELGLVPGDGGEP